MSWPHTFFSLNEHHSNNTTLNFSLLNCGHIHLQTDYNLLKTKWIHFSKSPCPKELQNICLSLIMLLLNLPSSLQMTTCLKMDAVLMDMACFAFFKKEFFNYYKDSSAICILWLSIRDCLETRAPGAN